MRPAGPVPRQTRPRARCIMHGVSSQDTPARTPAPVPTAGCLAPAMLDFAPGRTGACRVERRHVKLWPGRDDHREICHQTIPDPARRRRVETQFTPNPRRPECKSVLERLRQLDLSRATEADVEAIVGNRSWTALQCAECNRECDTAIEFGGDPAAGTPPVWICPACLSRAYVEITGTPVPADIARQMQSASDKSSAVTEPETVPPG
jgi:hypothetical protein